jgi:hypothetical protein
MLSWKCHSGPLARVICAVAVMLVAAVAPIVAQTPGTASHRPPVRTFGQVRLGAVYFTPRAVLENVGIEYGRDQAEARQTAFTFSVFFGENVTLVSRKLWVSADVGVNYTYTSRLPEVPRNLNPSLRGVRAEYFASPRLTLFGNGNYAYTTARPNFEVDTRVRRLDASLGGGARFTATARMGADLQAQWSRVNYDKSAVYLGVDLARSLNQSRLDVTATLSYGLTRLTSVFVPLSWRRDRFEFETGRDGETRSIGGGVRFNPRAFLSGALETGRSRLQLRSAAVPGYSGWYWRAVTAVAFRDTTAIEFSSQQNISFSYDVSRAYYVYRWNGVFVRQRMGQRFDAGPFYNTYTSRYAGSSTASDTTHVWGASVGLVRRQSRYDVYVSYWDRGANPVPGYGYYGWRFGFRILTPRVNISERGMFLNGPMGTGVIQP